MPLLPDPAELNAVADRINAHATATRDRASRLGAAVAAADWRGLAATAFHAEAQLTIGSLGIAAARLDDAADALRRHAGRVSSVLADLAALGSDGLQIAEDLVAHPDQLLSDAGKLLSDGADLAGDALHLFGL